MVAPQNDRMVDYNYKPKESPTDFGWYNRDDLPHLDAEEFVQFITFRLYDSLPQSVLDAWREERITDELMRRRIEGYVDSGYGSCLLKDPRVAGVLKDTLLFHDRIKYILHAWVLMPNHAHILAQPLKGVHLPKLIHSIKSYSAQEANRVLGRTGKFWQHAFFDRYIRNLRHFSAVVRYIHNNPVKAGLCSSPEEWVFSSAYSADGWASRDARPPDIETI